MRLLVIFTYLLCATSALAQGWVSTLTSHSYGPPRLLAVDKSSQTLVMLERFSPLRELLRFPCTTGQADGDKLVEGDLRTPEGVYFIGQRINWKLDWDLYGDLAYALNYPNPVDRIKGKTGSGIWIHGRGKEFLPRDTQGCVALKVPDMHDVAREFALGTPVVIAHDLSWTREPGGEDAVAEALAAQLRQWARDWENMSDAFFEHYDPVGMSLSERNGFNAFKAHKKSVFASKPWIEVMVDNIQAVSGPDYWVTWFDQYYRTAGLATNTGKRFYWQRDGEGRWRIVGREYTRPGEDLTPKYMAAKTEQSRELVQAWRTAWLTMDAENYRDFYTSGAVQGKRRGAAAITEYKKTLWERTAPVKLEIGELTVSQHPRGIQVAFLQTFQDASGYSDVGRKTLVLVPDGGALKIESEEWRQGR
ncbi:L,D-transpeptidase family protein [Pseudodesulfovibrio sp. F-1]|uniref:L,D-transpeptidase family protein n=1 Tax=Pseudodesulfovibrio alkaliphilus TaxID=2661613 RepID=A0A7K1KPD7_9BACT|nr:L,D-transpeptidase family protein [Pseudodesulfovibrio alkaliphilus]MUM77937.1 L,D-transpeptidase family protein [Pseudodesulfovibrio alkaliphilus]